uniref:Uncharacterized protein n=1 Tax=Sphaerodactylus townsendi TaxID=933632 RepID=A0ACB8GD05_9SAUR
MLICEFTGGHPLSLPPQAARQAKIQAVAGKNPTPPPTPPAYSGWENLPVASETPAGPEALIRPAGAAEHRTRPLHDLSTRGPFFLQKHQRLLFAPPTDGWVAWLVRAPFCLSPARATFPGPEGGPEAPLGGAAELAAEAPWRRQEEVKPVGGAAELPLPGQRHL